MAKNVRRVFRQFWEGWVRIARIIGNFQACVLLTLFYAVILLPFAVCVRLFADSLRMKHRPTAWLDRAQDTLDMSWAHKQ
jgi:hypothetical protein